ELSNEGLAQFQRDFLAVMDGAIASSQRAGQVMDSVLGEAFARLGGDLHKAQTGITVTGQAALDAFGIVVKNIEASGRSAKENAAILEEAFRAALGKISTAKGLELLEAQLESVGAKGVETGELLDLIRQKAEELNKTPMKGGADGLVDSLNKAKGAAEALSSAITADNGEAEHYRKRKSRLDGFSQALTNARETVTALSAAA